MKKVLLFCLAFAGSISLFADNAGFWADDAAKLTYSVDGLSGSVTWGASKAPTLALGSLTDLQLNTYSAKVWKKLSVADVTGVTMYYRLGSEGEIQSMVADFGEDLGDDNGSRNQRWDYKGESLTVTEGLPNGDYTLSIWFKATTTDGDKYLSNNSTNYQITFTKVSTSSTVFYLAGNGTEGSDWCCGYSWKEDKCELTDNTVTYSQLPAGTYQFKITAGTWSRTWGYEAMDATNSTAGYGTDDDGNVVFQLAEAADVTIAFAGGKITLTVSGGLTPVNPSCYGIQMSDGTVYEATKNDSYTGEGSEYMLLGVNLTAGAQFRLWNACEQAGWVEPLDGAGTMCVEKGETWYEVTEAGAYDIYIKMIGYQNNVVYIGGGSCSKHGAVPSQSTDVLMQGFYYNSYEVNDTANNGTDRYGDTRWRTLLKQSSEIGAYFDGIWLPPSALSSGTGYHPRQYSNQNSDWGTRTELETLIKAFHNSGTKVIADIVANHAEAMASWCDFPQLNFGEYGVFQPDGSWICKDDEMNEDWTNNDSLANECWGTASGAYDDGFGDNHGYYKDARDWSHSEVKVQEMFKAYLLWMKNVIGYDGWRYDKGDGYHNWHMDNYNRASNPDIAFMEYWSGNSEIQNGIKAANMNVMALDFQTVYSAINPIAGWNFVGRGGGLMADDYWKKYAVTWVDNHA